MENKVGWLMRAAVAVCVLLTIGLVWVFLIREKQATAILNNSNKNADRSTAIVRQEVNTTGREKKIQLPDGTLIVLANKSAITYLTPFTARRNVTLTGKAWFKVAKDKLHPFMVRSGEISTTALGTDFSVTAFEGTDSITVRLYEGKVVVKAADKAVNTMKKEVYLLPGQEFVYDGQTGNIRSFILKQTTAPELLINEP